jgi:hypothetical protein
MIKFFRLSKHNFVQQNRMSFGHLVEIALPAGRQALAVKVNA